MKGVYEIVLYQLKPGVEREKLLAVSERAAEWLRTQPGYLTRELLQDQSGVWVDMLRWASLDEALAAATAFNETAEAAAYMDVVDPDSIRMMHALPVATYD